MNKLLSKLIFFIIFYNFSNSSFGQKDTKFWFAVPEVSIDGGALLDRNIALKISSFGEAATITVSLPALPLAIPISSNVSSNSTVTIDLTDWIDQLENKPADVVLNYGLLIESTKPITAYYEVISGGQNMPRNNPEAFILKGRNALGLDFFIPSQNLLPNASNYFPSPFNSFDIVATENNTTISITPSNDITGHLAVSGPFSVILNRGQTYSATATGNSTSSHLQGSKVTANKPIAITVKDDLLHGSFYGGNCADLTGDQIVPISIIGTEYIAIKTQLTSPGDYLFVTATQNATQIFKDGGAAPIATINAGQTYNFPIGLSNSTYITTSRPAYVWQLGGSGCEVGATVLPPIVCTGSDTVSYVRSSNLDLYVNLLTRSGNQNSFLINGATVAASSFSDVPGTSGNWKAAIINLPISQYPYNSTIKVINTAGFFHMSTVDINGGGTSYGYFSNYGNFVDISLEGASDLCIGDTIKLSAPNIDGLVCNWSGPNGMQSTNQNLEIYNVQNQHSGWYYLELSGAVCAGKDSILISINENPIISITTIDSTLCSGESTILNASGGTDYTWTPSESVSNPNSNSTQVSPQNSTTFYVVAKNGFGCTSSDSVSITVEEFPELLVSSQDSIIGCSRNNTKLYAKGATSYLWSPANLVDDATSPNPTAYPSSNTTFYVSGYSKNGCESKDSVTIKYLEESYYFTPNAFSPNADGINDDFKPFVYCKYEIIYFSIFNRYGQLVFKSHGQNKGWNGTFRDKNADAGVYFWHLSLKDKDGNNVFKKGDVTLIR